MVQDKNRPDRYSSKKYIVLESSGSPPPSEIPDHRRQTSPSSEQEIPLLLLPLLISERPRNQNHRYGLKGRVKKTRGGRMVQDTIMA